MARILIVDDSAVMRRALTSIMEREPGLQIVGTAVNGQQALEKIPLLKPDLLTLDIEMPVMDGLTTLDHIRQLPKPRPAVLMCSTLTQAGSHAALRAMRLGAVDYIAKDPEALGSGSDAARKELVAKVRAIIDTRRLTSIPPRAGGHVPPSPVAAPDLRARGVELVAIGSSTGGPPVLEVLLAALPQDLSVPIVVAQHMPALFTRSMSERLGQMCRVPVVHADQARTELQPGSVYVIVGGRHGAIRRTGGARPFLEVSDEPREALYRPSADALLGSAAVALGKHACAIVLTGMGSDGALGAGAVHRAGGVVIAQSAATCAVYGMPRSVVEAAAATAVCDPEAIAKALAALGPRARAAA